MSIWCILLRSWRSDVPIFNFLVFVRSKRWLSEIYCLNFADRVMDLESIFARWLLHHVGTYFVIRRVFLVYLGSLLNFRTNWVHLNSPVPRLDSLGFDTRAASWLPVFLSHGCSREIVLTLQDRSRSAVRINFASNFSTFCRNLTFIRIFKAIRPFSGLFRRSWSG